jgi:hypothetical protein
MTTLEMARGDDVLLDVGPVLDNEGTVVDLTGLSLAFTAKYHIRDGDVDALFQKWTPTDIDIPTGTDGMATVDVLAADTDSLPYTTVLYWDLQLIDGTSAIQTLAKGRLVVNADVTRAIVAGS